MQDNSCQLPSAPESSVRAAFPLLTFFRCACSLLLRLAVFRSRLVANERLRCTLTQLRPPPIARAAHRRASSTAAWCSRTGARACRLRTHSATPDRTTRLADLSALKVEADSSENAILAVSCLAPSRVAAAHRAAQCMVSVITVKRVIRSNCVNAQARGQVAAGGRNLNASPLYAANTAPACRRIEQVAAHSWQLLSQTVPSTPPSARQPSLAAFTTASVVGETVLPVAAHIACCRPARGELEAEVLEAGGAGARGRWR